MGEGLQLCYDFGVFVFQVVGYYCYYEQMNDYVEQWYIDFLFDVVLMVVWLGVVMGIENVDGIDVIFIWKVMEFVKFVDLFYLQVYLDFGNIVE